MRNLYFVFLCGICSLGKAQITASSLQRKHWLGNYTKNADTLNFVAYPKYKSSYYQWGGSAEGWQFLNDTVMQKYYNVFCSTESDPKTLFTSKWKLNKDTLEIDSDSMNEKYKILQYGKKTMRVKLISLKAKEVKMIQIPLEKGKTIEKKNH